MNQGQEEKSTQSNQLTKTSRSFLPFAATWIDLKSTMLSEVNQTQKDKYHVTDVTYMWAKKKGELRYKQRTDCRGGMAQ